MQSNKEQVIAGAQANLVRFQEAETQVRETNVAAVASNVSALVDNLIQGTPCPVVQLKVPMTGVIEPIQAFLEKANVLAADANGAIAISDYEFETYVRTQPVTRAEISVRLQKR